ncbi:hypothetical protein VC218_02035 [Xanthomonas nasturtii]|uniref:hypothetical protein n=1 Tax=Xanthomonas nasturtii TaxID=1843581 RepID=UPI002B237796|nr:hypothetical protein [Xanthomonas nasturtii]MEA9577738.1 hypothetical protein [Xanthomonas nasturtii]
MDYLDGFPGRSLWAEDGHVFIYQAIVHGLKAVISPSAGYLHLYPRLLSWLAVNLDVHLLASVMLGGWIVGYCVSTYFVVQRLRAQGVPIAAACSFLLLLALSPSTAETLFTVTNVQWYLAIGLSACVLLPPKESDTWPALFFISLASLTGPFCIILLPVAVLQMALLKDFERRQKVLLILVVATLIQLSFFTESERLSASSSRDIAGWMAGLRAAMTFGSTNVISYWAGICFWVCLLFALVRLVHRHGLKSSEVHRASTLLIAAVFFLGAGFYAMRSMPASASPIGFGSRYFIIPYGLLLIAAILIASPSRLLMTIIVAAYSVVGVCEFKKFDRDDFGYSRYIDFATVHDNVFVPINPQFSDFRGGFILKLPQNKSDRTSVRKLDNVALQHIPWVSDSQQQLSTLQVPASMTGCLGPRTTLGILVAVELDEAAAVTVRWADQQPTRPAPPVVYPAGRSTIQVAISAAYTPRDTLAVAFTQKVASIRVESAEFYCITHRDN